MKVKPIQGRNHLTRAAERERGREGRERGERDRDIQRQAKR